MSEHETYLTVDKNPNGPGLLAILTKGQPQLGDEHCIVLTLEIVPTVKAARKWAQRMKIGRPWEVRN